MKSPSSSTGCIVSQSLHADKHYHPKRLLGPDQKMCSSRKVLSSLKSVEKHLLPVIARIPRAEGKEGRRLNLSARRGADRRKCRLRGTERTTARSLVRSSNFDKLGPITLTTTQARETRRGEEEKLERRRLAGIKKRGQTDTREGRAGRGACRQKVPSSELLEPRIETPLTTERPEPNSLLDSNCFTIGSVTTVSQSDQ